MLVLLIDVELMQCAKWKGMEVQLAIALPFTLTEILT